MTHREDERLLAKLRKQVEVDCVEKFTIRPGNSKKILVVCLITCESRLCYYKVFHYEKIGNFWNHWLIVEKEDGVFILRVIEKYVNENYRD